MGSIDNKLQMYAHLAAGHFGNHAPMYYSLEEWQPHAHEDDLYGIRSLCPGARCLYYVPTAEVPATVRQYWSLGSFIIAPMQPDWAIRLQGELIHDPLPSLFCSTVKKPMRLALAEDGRHYSGPAALSVLRHYLDPSSYACLEELSLQYPGHAIEFSQYACPVGVLGGFMLIWEVRNY
jgi:hypothetical protein